MPRTDFDPQAELALVRAARAGQPAAVEQLAQRMRCVPRMLAFLNRQRGRPLDDHDLADLAQDVALVALRKLGEYAALAPLEGWLSRLCQMEFQNAARSRGRRMRRHQELPEEQDPAAEPGAEPHAHDDLHRALAQIGGAEAEILRLKHFDGLTFPEIGTRCRIPAATAKTRYHRGLEKLARLLGRNRQPVGKEESR